MVSVRRKFLFLFLFCCAFTSAANAEPLREIRIKAAISPTFKNDPEWERDIRDRVIFVNKIIEPLLNVHFSIQQYIDWTPQDELRETD